jgi:hypothetical protein
MSDSGVVRWIGYEAAEEICDLPQNLAAVGRGGVFRILVARAFLPCRFLLGSRVM